MKFFIVIFSDFLWPSSPPLFSHLLISPYMQMACPWYKVLQCNIWAYAKFSCSYVHTLFLNCINRTQFGIVGSKTYVSL